MPGIEIETWAHMLYKPIIESDYTFLLIYSSNLLITQPGGQEMHLKMGQGCAWGVKTIS